jgi:hypothetical protein
MSAPSEASVVPFPLPAPAEPRPPGSRRKHAPETVAAVRLLYEGTCLSHAEIARRTGVTGATVSYWYQAGGWVRPAKAPKARVHLQNGLPTHRLKGLALARRLREAAERQAEAAEQEEAEGGGAALTCIAWALKLLDMAREEEQAALRRRRSLAWRARVAAERMLDHMERHPEEADKHDLALVREMLWMIRDEEERRRRDWEQRKAARAARGGGEAAGGPAASPGPDAARTRLSGTAVAT